MAGKKYNVEFIPAETGDEESHNYIKFIEAEELLLRMQEGDDMVVHCLGQQPDLHGEVR